MEIRMKDVVGVQEFYNTIKDKKLPIKTAFKLSKIIRDVSSHIEFYQKRMSQIMEESAERDTDGNFVIEDEGRAVRLKKDKIAQVAKEMKELQELPMILNEEKLRIEELSGLDLTIEEMMTIAPLLED